MALPQVTSWTSLKSGNGLTPERIDVTPLEREGSPAMAKLIYSAITSLDGYVADEKGNFDWAEPNEDVHTFVNDLERQVGTYLYGRGMYEVMVAWATMPLVDQPPHVQDYAEIWRATDKIVYSRTLKSISSARTRIERHFDAEAVRRMKAQGKRDISVGGPDLAAQAFEAGLVDECHLFLAPVVVGGGKRSLPSRVRLKLELMDERRFDNGVVHLHYRIKREGTTLQDGVVVSERKESP